ncbi:MAG: hypothetical protein LBM08_14330, partial [Dysgonamonadaceae bacterium]|nr:hypothetical protein [Dysgonamonadaceae bacterium]
KNLRNFDEKVAQVELRTKVAQVLARNVIEPDSGGKSNPGPSQAPCEYRHKHLVSNLKDCLFRIAPVRIAVKITVIPRKYLTGKITVICCNRKNNSNRQTGLHRQPVIEAGDETISENNQETA